MYHISLRDDLEGAWVPRHPCGGELTLGEMPRISTAPTVRQCFMGIYPNISHIFEVYHHAYVDVSVYSPMFTWGERVLPPEEILRLRWEPDAHVTQEHAILDPVYMKRIGSVRIRNTTNSTVPFVTYHPYDDMMVEVVELAPVKFSAMVLQSTETIVLA